MSIEAKEGNGVQLKRWRAWEAFLYPIYRGQPRLGKIESLRDWGVFWGLVGIFGWQKWVAEEAKTTWIEGQKRLKWEHG